jgi:hypothetical protein
MAAADAPIPIWRAGQSDNGDDSCILGLLGTISVAVPKSGRRFLGIVILEKPADGGRARLQEAEVEYQTGENGRPTPSKSRKPRR